MDSGIIVTELTVMADKLAIYEDALRRIRKQMILAGPEKYELTIAEITEVLGEDEE